MAFMFADESILTSAEQLNCTGPTALPIGVDPYRAVLSARYSWSDVRGFLFESLRA